MPATHNRVHPLGLSERLLIIGSLTVLTVLVQTTQAQSFLLTLSQNPNQYHSQSTYARPNSHNTEANRVVEARDVTLPYNRTHTTGRQHLESDAQDSNSSVILVKNPAREKPSELSQTAMDVITIVWYVATFLALAAFFLLMACSDRRCADAPGTGSNNNNDAPIPPPTPSPSYSEFAPPSYETVMKMQHAAKTTIFVIPFGLDSAKENSSINNINNNNNNNNNSINNTSSTPTTPNVNFYTINELQKLGS